jgi:hypothetical protein
VVHFKLSQLSANKVGRNYNALRVSESSRVLDCQSRIGSLRIIVVISLRLAMIPDSRISCVSLFLIAFEDNSSVNGSWKVKNCVAPPVSIAKTLFAFGFAAKLNSIINRASFLTLPLSFCSISLAIKSTCFWHSSLAIDNYSIPQFQNTNHDIIRSVRK